MDPGDLEQGLQQQILLPILRMQSADLCLDLAGSLIKNGFALFEITLDTPEACRLIQTLSSQGARVGAGTVLTAADAQRALAHGAHFLVSPGLSLDVAKVASEAGVPYVPGVLTPTEITQALNLGLHLLKLFPAVPGGPTYLKQLSGPFKQVSWLVTGGIELADIPAWRQAGAFAVGQGSRLVSAQDLAAGDWQAIGNALQEIRKWLDDEAPTASIPV